jgi:hypothetical protein
LLYADSHYISTRKSTHVNQEYGRIPPFEGVIAWKEKGVTVARDFARSMRVTGT